MCLWGGYQHFGASLKGLYEGPIDLTKKALEEGGQDFVFSAELCLALLSTEERQNGLGLELCREGSMLSGCHLDVSFWCLSYHSPRADALIDGGQTVQKNARITTRQKKNLKSRYASRNIPCWALIE